MSDYTPAQTKAIEAGGTNNVPVGNSLVKKGIFEDSGKGLHEFRFVPVGTMAKEIEAEKEYAEAIEKEENETPTSEEWEIAQHNARERHEEIEALSDEYMTCDAERGDEIEARLRELGAFVPVLSKTSDAEVRLAEAIDADDMEAAKQIIEEAAPAVVVRDPKETRYAHVDRWTDENLLTKYGILHRRLMRRTLLKADRMQAERHCQKVENELLSRGIRPDGK